MTEITATGFDAGNGYAPKLSMSGGRGNTPDVDEVWVHLRDPRTGSSIYGWWPASAVAAALAEARAIYPPKNGTK